LHPILVIGLTQRSGTNHLLDLLLQHPQCTSARSLDEDHFLRSSGPLRWFVGTLYNRWVPEWTARDRTADLTACLGDGFLQFLDLLAAEERAADGEQHVQTRFLVTKTPHAANLRYTFDFFPSAKLLVLVRDPRAVVESASAGFGWSHDLSMSRWADAAREVVEARRAASWRPEQALVVRYEDLVQNMEEEVVRILAFCGLPVEEYDFAGASALGVRGSSFFRGSQGKVHWQPVTPTEDFNPVERRMQWTPAMKRRLAWTCGDGMREFGYTEDAPRPSGAASAIHRLRDLRWLLEKGARRGVRELITLRSFSKGFSRPDVLP
jgi:hypothetical protein